MTTISWSGRYARARQADFLAAQVVEIADTVREGKKVRISQKDGTTIALQALVDEEGEQITRKAIEIALAGNSTALRLVLERLIPPVRERRLPLDLRGSRPQRVF